MSFFTDYTEHRFNDRKQAEMSQKKMKKNYGYTPAILHVHKRSTKESFFIVVKPKGLKKI